MTGWMAQVEKNNKIVAICYMQNFKHYIAHI